MSPYSTASTPATATTPATMRSIWFVGRAAAALNVDVGETTGVVVVGALVVVDVTPVVVTGAFVVLDLVVHGAHPVPVPAGVVLLPVVQGAHDEVVVVVVVQTAQV